MQAPDVFDHQSWMAPAVPYACDRAAVTSESFATHSLIRQISRNSILRCFGDGLGNDVDALSGGVLLFQIATERQKGKPQPLVERPGIAPLQISGLVAEAGTHHPFGVGCTTISTFSPTSSARRMAGTSRSRSASSESMISASRSQAHRLSKLQRRAPPLAGSITAVRIETAGRYGAGRLGTGTDCGDAPEVGNLEAHCPTSLGGCHV
jgi:hypothetical protein